MNSLIMTTYTGQHFDLARNTRTFDETWRETFLSNYEKRRDDVSDNMRRLRNMLIISHIIKDSLA